LFVFLFYLGSACSGTGTGTGYFRNEQIKPRAGYQVLATIPEVIEAYLVSGEYDYLLRVAVKDTKDYERLLREKLYKIKGIRHSKSSFVLRTLKKADLPLIET
jgi:DNA-binding Lrp family transcriptional regulator